MRSALVVLTTVALAGTGMSLEAQTPAARTHLEIAIWYDGAMSDLGPLNDIAWMFQQHHPEVIVNLRRHATLTAYPLLTRWTGVDAGSAPDLVVISASWLPQFQAALAPLDSLAASPAAQKIVPPALQLFTADGHLKAVPWGLGARVLLVRSDLLQDKGLTPPTTWEQVTAVAASLHNPPQVYGLGLPGAREGGGAALLQEMMWAEGDPAFDGRSAVDLATEGKACALARFVELAKSAQPEVLSWSQNELEQLFALGRLGMLVTDTWVARSWRGVQGIPAYQVLPLPGSKQPMGRLLGDGLAVFARSPKRDLASKFAQMVLTAQAQQRLTEWGGLPVHQDLIEKAVSDPLLGPLMPTLAGATILFPHQPPALSKALDYALYLAVSGRATPAAALAAAQEMLRGEQGSPVAPGAPAGVG